MHFVNSFCGSNIASDLLESWKDGKSAILSDINILYTAGENVMMDGRLPYLSIKF